MTPSLINWTFSCIDSDNNRINPPNNLKQAISQIKELPPLPGIAEKIMKLAADPLADSKKLTEIIALDPLLTTQVVRWASSSLYGYKGKINSVEDAINRVLGYQFVFDLVLGLSALSPLKAPSEGTLGTRRFWTHALASTHLLHDLNQLLTIEDRFDTQTIFLVAIMHNIGFPLLADQFRTEFNMLSDLIQANPSLNLVKLEKFAFGVSHCELGSWLMKTWEMPTEIVDVIYHHHNPHYRGENYKLNLLTYLNDSLLASINIGDTYQDVDFEQIQKQLNLTSFDQSKLLETLENKLDNIISMVEICLNKN